MSPNKDKVVYREYAAEARGLPSNLKYVVSLHHIDHALVYQKEKSYESHIYPQTKRPFPESRGHIIPFSTMVSGVWTVQNKKSCGLWIEGTPHNIYERGAQGFVEKIP